MMTTAAFKTGRRGKSSSSTLSPPVDDPISTRLQPVMMLVRTIPLIQKGQIFPDCRNKTGQFKRFGYVVDNDLLEPFHPFVRGIHGGQHGDEVSLQKPRLFYFPNGSPAVQSGHHDIHQDYSPKAVAQMEQALIRTDSGNDVNPFRAKQSADRFTDTFFIINQQDLWFAGFIPVPRNCPAHALPPAFRMKLTAAPPSLTGLPTDE